jgi:trehalose 6-phosphate synthase/phosphatase
MKHIVISNRLPFVVSQAHGKLSLEKGSGGLVSGLESYLSPQDSKEKRIPYIWVGWPGMSAENDQQAEQITKQFQKHQAYPVFLDQPMIDAFYHGFCNKTIWPLFHYFPNHTIYDASFWQSYKDVNQSFFDAVKTQIEPGDTIWIHDYHLLLLPKLIREAFSSLSIGFFLHIPFPSFEMFRLMPQEWRKEILEGMLGADLIGFHTHEYTQYFLQSVLRVLGCDHTFGQINTDERIVKAETFPMGIDFNKFYDAQKQKEVQEEKTQLSMTLQKMKTILSIDRLDYTKGVLNRLEGYELFLQSYPEWRGKITFIMVTVPSRVEVESYRDMKKQIEERIGNINGTYGSIGWTPIIYQYRSLTPIELNALYGQSDVALITPLRDGMNLVAKEYIASQNDHNGVLILSEMTGAAKELGESIIINPNNIEEIAKALNTALMMDEDEKKRRLLIMQARLKRYDVRRWAGEFFNELTEIKHHQSAVTATYITTTGKQLIRNEYMSAKKCLVFIDYDGTLVPFSSNPYEAYPTQRSIDILTNLSADSNTDVVLVSGRDWGTLQKWFGQLPIGIMAEHGIFVKPKNMKWTMTKPLNNTWKKRIMPLLELYSDRLPGALIEQKQYSIVWHYRMTDPELGPIRAQELIDDLMHFTANLDISVVHSTKAVEIKNAGVNKGVAANIWLKSSAYDFILAVCDDVTDEDLFQALPASAYSLKIGTGSSHARYNLKNYHQALDLLSSLEKHQNLPEITPLFT